MTALGEIGTIKEISPNLGVKVIQIVTAATVVSADTFTVDLGDYGCTNIHGILGFVETTAGSVVVSEAPTTAVSAGVLTVTVGGTSVTKARTYIVYAY
jgi:hypothetical protein